MFSEYSPIPAKQQNKIIIKKLNKEYKINKIKCVPHHAVAFAISTCYRAYTVTRVHLNQKQGLEKSLVRAGTALTDCSPLFLAIIYRTNKIYLL